MNRYLLPILLLVLAGCGPSGCRVSDPAALLPVDSLSRDIAMEAPAHELEVVGELRLEDVAPHPRTIQFSPDRSTLYVGDTRSHFVARVDLATGNFERIDHDTFRNPYLAGFLGDTLLVLNPARRHIDYLVNGAVERSIDLPDFDDRRTLRYAAVHQNEVYVKSVSESAGTHVSRFTPDGEEAERVELEGPFWRHSGMLRSWDENLLSLSGYRPVIDIISPEMTADSLRLMGFDSPMLARSRRYVEGEARNAPLLTAAASPLGDKLWLLNMRPGWIQIDAYDRDGRIIAIFTQPEPTPDRRFYPVDILAHRDADGSTLLHVLLARPEARVITYRARLN
jgi:hypothetical protein